MHRSELGFLADPHLREAALRRALRVTRDYADAEDAVQDAALRALRFASSFRPGARGAPWFLRIVRHASTDLAAGRARRERAILPPDAAAVSDTEHAVLERERSDALRTALGHLPPQQRRLVLLHDVAGETTRAIAGRDGLPHSTVRTRLRRARLALRALLAERLAA